MGLENGQPISDRNDDPPDYEDTVGDGSDAVKARVDGRIDINLNSRLAKTLSRFMVKPDDHPEPPPDYELSHAKASVALNIVIQVVGSRGDVQPFVALGNELQKNGHRVRLATHDTFKHFVTSAALEFYPIGGDPEALMAYMVKNPGLLPSMKTLRSGEIQKKRDMMAKMLEGCWRACVEPDLDSATPFVADIIIANPPSFAHVHCAEALGVPVHMMFTMPWTSTESFPHPLANIRSSSFDEKFTNRLSYAIVDWMMWQGLGDLINGWRKRHDLEPVPASEGPFLTDLLEIPTTYCWSPALVPKPADWPRHIDVCGFFFRDPPQYSPPPELDAFLRAGPAPIYIGFGSIVIEDPEALTNIVLEAVAAAGVRAIISKGWSGLGNTIAPQSHDVLFIGDCPHEWLFQRVAAVIHHGGAGTTACGLSNACPTAIVPFFGDQPFWGAMVATAGAGPNPIRQKFLSASNLSSAIKFCLTEEAKHAAKELSMRMRGESGVKMAVDSFHRSLCFEELSCDLLPQYAATWHLKHSAGSIKLSNVAAEILISRGIIQEKNLRLHRTKPITIQVRRWDIVTASSSSMIGTTSDIVSSLTGIVSRPYEELRRSREDSASSSSNAQTAGTMALASAKSVGNLNSDLFKGLVLDLPLAVTEGLRATPKLYGEAVPDHKPITDWKSGAVVAGKEFAHGMIDGLSGFVMEPYRGAKKDGVKGFLAGVGKGSIAGITTKVSSGAIGLVAYPSQGIYKSLRTLTHAGTSKSIAAARREERSYLLPRHEVDVKDVLKAWEWHISPNRST